MNARTKTPDAAQRSTTVIANGARYVAMVPVVPMGAVRQNRNTRYSPDAAVRRRVESYEAWKAELKLRCNAAGVRAGEELYVTAVIPVPASLSAKERAARLAAGTHTQKPDWDNIAKAVQDALLKDDSSVTAGGCRKRWGLEGWTALGNCPAATDPLLGELLGTGRVCALWQLAPDEHFICADSIEIAPDGSAVVPPELRVWGGNVAAGRPGGGRGPEGRGAPVRTSDLVIRYGTERPQWHRRLHG